MSQDHWALKRNQLRFLSNIHLSRLEGDEKWVIDSATIDHIAVLATHESIEYALTQENKEEAYKARYNQVLDELAPIEKTTTRSGSAIRRL